jgi:hypothetical protein
MQRAVLGAWRRLVATARQEERISPCVGALEHAEPHAAVQFGQKRKTPPVGIVSAGCSRWGQRQVPDEKVERKRNRTGRIRSTKKVQQRIE